MQTPGGTDLTITISTELTQTTVTFKRLNWEGTYSYLEPIARACQPS
jgi:hypothetical protein